MTPDPNPVRVSPKLGDYFAFFGLPRKLGIDSKELERRFRDLSRQFHPDFFYNAPPRERLESLEKSSFLNDAYRVLKDPTARVDYLLALEGLEARTDGAPKVPPALLEEVFELNEQLDEIRELRESGADAGTVRARLEIARRPIDAKRDAHERELQELSAAWDSTGDRTVLTKLRERVLERNYINNLLATIQQEMAKAEAPERMPHG